jgi:hypothetical protein
MPRPSLFSDDKGTAMRYKNAGSQVFTGGHLRSQIRRLPQVRVPRPHTIETVSVGSWGSARALAFFEGVPFAAAQLLLLAGNGFH